MAHKGEAEGQLEKKKRLAMRNAIYFLERKFRDMRKFLK
jgi:hypothetical protein